MRDIAVRTKIIESVQAEGVDLTPSEAGLYVIGFEVQGAGAVVYETTNPETPGTPQTIQTVEHVLRPWALAKLYDGTTALPLIVLYGRRR